MTRNEALNLVRQYVKNENSVKHMFATEAIMRALARRFKEDEEIWGLAGLLHDMDIEIVDWKTHPEQQGAVGAKMLEEMGVDTIITNAIRAHNEATGKTRDNLIEKAIYAADPLTGLIVAATLVLPSRKIGDLIPENVLNRFKEKSFARGARRDAIASCTEIDLSLEEFAKIGLEAMQEISSDLGL
ncbi:HDIG domain-containing protein [Candidatus Parcubacteria bacterium]|nr:HDIG domain-containing protein [Patescibacteria group bacterium]MCG2688786.1 HDIG domain-containing protein [Candidatus Parcubacteria bacterium]